MTSILSIITDKSKHCFYGKTDGNANSFELWTNNEREVFAHPKAHLYASRNIMVLWKHVCGEETQNLPERMVTEDGVWIEMAPGVVYG